MDIIDHDTKGLASFSLKHLGNGVCVKCIDGKVSEDGPFYRRARTPEEEAHPDGFSIFDPRDFTPYRYIPIEDIKE